MAILIRSESTGGTTTAADGTFSVTKPATLANGDYLICIIGKEDDPDIAPPGDWTTGGEGSQTTGNDVFLGIYYKKVTNAAGEGASYTFDSAGLNENVGWWIGAVANLDGTTPQDVTFVNPTNLQNDTSPNTPAVVTATDKALALACWAVNSDTATTPPGSPWDTRADNVGGNGVLTVVSQIIATAGTTTDTPEITAVANNQESQVGMFVFRYGGDNIFVADADVVTQADAVVLSGISSSLVVADAFSTSQVDAIVTTKETALTIADADVTTQTDAVVLEVIHNLTVDDAACTTQADNVVLEYVAATGRARVTWVEFQIPLNTTPTVHPADGYSDTQVDNVTLTVTYNLVIQNTFAATQADEVATTKSDTLVVADTDVTTQSDNAALTQAHVLLVADGASETQVDAVTVSIAGNLVVASAYVTTQTDSFVITKESDLIVADAACVTQTDALVLTQAHSLTVADSYSDTQADALTLAQTHVLIMAMCYAVTQTDALVLTVEGANVGIIRAWTLPERDIAWSLAERDIAWSLAERDIAWSMDDRSTAATLSDRDTSLTMEER